MTAHTPQAWRGLLRDPGATDLRFEASSPSLSRAEVKTVLPHEGLHVVRCDLSSGAIFCRSHGDQASRRYAVVISHGVGLSVSRSAVVHQLRSGDAVVLRNWEAGRIDGKSAFRISVLSLPCESLNVSGMDIERALAQGISRHAEGLVLLRRYLQVVEKDAGARRSSEASALIAHHIRDLLLLTLARRPGDLDGNVKITLLETRLDAVTAYLESNFRDPSTSYQKPPRLSPFRPVMSNAFCKAPAGRSTSA